MDITNIKYILIGRDNQRVRKWLNSLAIKYNLEIGHFNDKDINKL